MEIQRDSLNFHEGVPQAASRPWQSGADIHASTPTQDRREIDVEACREEGTVPVLARRAETMPRCVRLESLTVSSIVSAWIVLDPILTEKVSGAAVRMTYTSA